MIRVGSYFFKRCAKTQVWL